MGMAARAQGRALAREVAKAIRTHAELYDQRKWAHTGEPEPECGTASCIAGWTEAVVLCGGNGSAPQVAAMRVRTEKISTRAGDALGIDGLERTVLFDLDATGVSHDGRFKVHWKPNAEDAAGTLDQYADHDVVEWVASSEEGRIATGVATA